MCDKITTFYILNLHNVIDQIYFIKSGKRKKKLVSLENVFLYWLFLECSLPTISENNLHENSSLQSPLSS